MRHPLPHGFFTNVKSNLLTKLACHFGISLWIIFFYYGPQHWPILSAHPAPALEMDAFIPFQPSWALFYQSVFLLHTLALWLPGSAKAVKRYTFQVAMAFSLSAPIFWLYPTLSPRLPSSNSLYLWLIPTVDGARNAFPSLHAAMGLLALDAVDSHIRGSRSPLLWSILILIYYIILLYSTLATRQHLILDLVAGIALAASLLAVEKILHRKPLPYEPLPNPSSLHL